MCVHVYMEISHRPYGHRAASLWLEVTFALAVNSSDRTAIRNLLFFTRLGLSDVLAKRTVVQSRDLSCSLSFSIKRKIVNAVSL